MSYDSWKTSPPECDIPEEHLPGYGYPDCPTCRGRGRWMDCSGHHVCPACEGKGWSETDTEKVL